MPLTPDRHPGPLQDEEIQLDDRAADGNPTVLGAIRRIGDTLMFKRTSDVIDLTSCACAKNVYDVAGTIVYVVDGGDMSIVTKA
jgi:hypothetical protein